MPDLSDLAALPRLHNVEIRWFADYWDGPLCGLAAYRGRDHWYDTVWNPGTDQHTDSPRLFVLYELTPTAAATAWTDHRAWVYQTGGPGCLHTPPCPVAPSLPPDAYDRWFATHPNPVHPPGSNPHPLGWFTTTP